MAGRENYGLAFKAQGAKGTPATAPFKLLPVAGWQPGVTFNRVEDNTIQTSGFAQPGRAGTVPLAPVLTVPFRAVAFDALLAAAFQSAWATNTLTQGNTKTYFTMEDRQSDAGAGAALLYSDILVNSFGMTLNPNGFVDSTFQFVGLNLVPGSSLSATPTAADDAEPYDTWSGSLTYAGGTADVTSLQFVVNNNYDPRFSIFSGRFPTRIPGSNKSLTGEMTIAYDGIDRITDALEDTRQELDFTLQYLGQSLNMVISSIVTTGWDAPVTNDAERLQTVRFEAEAALGTMVTAIRDNTV